MAESAPGKGGAVHPPRVLVVDDDADSAELLALFLSKRGYEVQTAGLLGDARSLLEQGGFDALLTDVRLPDGVGEELLARPGRGTLRAAFVVSGLCGDADIARWRALGFDGHFLKPLSLDRLAKAIAERLASTSLQGDHEGWVKVARSASSSCSASRALDRRLGAGGRALHQSSRGVGAWCLCQRPP